MTESLGITPEENFAKLIQNWNNALISYQTPIDFCGETSIFQVNGDSDSKSDSPIIVMSNRGFSLRKELMQMQREASKERREKMLPPRWTNDGDLCFLCDNVGQAESTGTNLLLDFNTYKDHIVVPNRYPIMRGHCLLVSKKHDGRNLHSALSLEYFDTIANLAETYGFHIIRNHAQAGMSIPNHEHSHVIPRKLFTDDGVEVLSYYPQNYRFLRTDYGEGIFALEGSRFDTLGFDRRKAIDVFQKCLKELDRNKIIFTFGYVIPKEAEGKNGLFLLTPHKKEDANRTVAGESPLYTKTIRAGSAFSYPEYMSFLSEHIYARGEFPWHNYIS